MNHSTHSHTLQQEPSKNPEPKKTQNWTRFLVNALCSTIFGFFVAIFPSPSPPLSLPVQPTSLPTTPQFPPLTRHTRAIPSSQGVSSPGAVIYRSISAVLQEPAGSRSGQDTGSPSRSTSGHQRNKNGGIQHFGAFQWLHRPLDGCFWIHWWTGP